MLAYWSDYDGTESRIVFFTYDSESSTIEKISNIERDGSEIDELTIEIFDSNPIILRPLESSDEVELYFIEDGQIQVLSISNDDSGDDSRVRMV